MQSNKSWSGCRLPQHFRSRLTHWKLQNAGKFDDQILCAIVGVALCMWRFSVWSITLIESILRCRKQRNIVDNNRRVFVCYKEKCGALVFSIGSGCCYNCVLDSNVYCVHRIALLLLFCSHIYAIHTVFDCMLYYVYLNFHTLFRSQKEKLALFAQISDCIQSPSLRSNAHYLNYLSNAISILLMFCEEMDSATRMR